MEEAARTPWDHPVMLVSRKTGEVLVVTTTEEAYDCLFSNWPTSEGRAFFAALEICNRVSIGTIDRQIARQAFIEAAKEAGVPIQNVISPPL
jgi:Protein of unknown function (DUF982)